MRRTFTVSGSIEPCPMCGNASGFVGRSERCAEDCCECWVECSCGYDPTASNTSHRLEDVIGEVSPNTLPTMMRIWNERVAASKAAKGPTKP